MELEEPKEDSSYYEIVTEVIGGCQICYLGLTDSNSVRSSCGHSFCKSCFSEYIMVRISDHDIYPLSCPASGCNEDIYLHAELVLEKETWRKLRKHRTRKELLTDRSVKWCPVVNCEGHGLQEGNNPIICNVCDKEITETRSPDSVEILQQSSVIECPRCGCFVERQLGCMNATCYCGLKFCLKCGSETGKNHDFWLCLVGKNDGSPSIFVALALVFSYVLLPFVPVLLVFWYKNYWDKNFLKVIDEHPWFYYPLIFLFSPIIVVCSLFWLPFFLGWLCVDCFFNEKEKLYREWWNLLKLFIYFPAVFLCFIGLLLAYGLGVAFAPAYGLAVLLYVIFWSEKKQ